MIPKESAAQFIERLNARQEAGRVVTAKDIGGQGAHTWTCEARTALESSRLEHVVFVLERLRWSTFTGSHAVRDYGPFDVEYRIGYYAVDANGDWKWGRYAPFVSAVDLKALLTQAAADGTLLGLGT